MKREPKGACDRGMFRRQTGAAGPEADPAHSEAKRRGWPWGASGGTSSPTSDGHDPA